MDKIVGVFLGALVAGTQNLAPYGVSLLGVLALIAYGYRFWPYVMSSGAGLGDVLAGFLMIMAGLGITHWLLLNIVPIGDALLQAALTLGLSVSSTGLTMGDLSSPSFLLRMHKIVTKPLEDFILAHSGWSVMWNGTTMASFWVAEILIYFAFVSIALDMAVIQLEFYFSILAGAVLLPTVVFQPSTFIGEAVIGWIIGAAIRVFLLMAVVGIGVPLFQGLTLSPAGGADPTWVEALGAVGGAALFAILAWSVPRKAANLVANGLGFMGSMVIGAAASSARVAMGFHGVSQVASRVISPMLQRS